MKTPEENGWTPEATAEVNAEQKRLQRELEKLLEPYAVVAVGMCCADALATAMGAMASDKQHVEEIIGIFTDSMRRIIDDQWEETRRMRAEALEHAN